MSTKEEDSIVDCQLEDFVRLELPVQKSLIHLKKCNFHIHQSINFQLSPFTLLLLSWYSLFSETWSLLKSLGFLRKLHVYVIFCWWEMTSSKPVQIICKKRFYLAPPTPPNNPSFIIWYFFNLKRTSLQLHFLSIFKKGDVQSFQIV